MIEWLKRVEASLGKALHVVEKGVPKENLYMLATNLYSQENHMNNDSLLNAMNEANDEQFKIDCSFDAQSKQHYKFHYVASYLNCYVVAGKIDEMKYDRIMDYINDNINLFSHD